MQELLRPLDGFLEASRRSRKWRTLTPRIAKLERVFARAFRKQGKAFLLSFARLRDAFPLQESVRDSDWEWMLDDASRETSDALEKALNKAVGDMMLAGASAALGQFAGVAGGISFDLSNPRAVEYIRQHGALLISKLDDESKQRIRQILQKGIAEGWSYDKIAGKLTKLFPEFAIGKPQQHIRSRGHLIAVTELGQAYEYGNWLVIEQLIGAGIDMEKSWSTVGDSRVSEGCQENEGQGWIPAMQPHASGHMYPLRFPGCRCDELYQRRQTNANA